MNANFERIAQDLVQQMSTRFPSMKKETVDGKPIDGKEHRDGDARKISFDFTNRRNGEKLTNVSISLSDADQKPALLVLWNKNPRDSSWIDFLDELGDFAQSHSLDFKLQNPSQSNLDKRDPIGEGNMNESRLSGTSRTSYQEIGEAKIIVRHNQPVNYNAPNGRTQHIERIFIENAVGERYAYPVKHLNGARALAQHVSQGGTPYDDIGKHVVSLSEELAKLRFFKNYVDRSEVISEAMGTIHSKVIERIEQIKKEVHTLQSPKNYALFKESFTSRPSRVVPEDILNDWVDRLTVRSFNEELKAVFPYIYSLVDESDIPVKDLEADDILSERVTPEWLDIYSKAKELLAKGMTPEQVAKQLGVQGPNNGMPGSMGGNWGAINKAANELKQSQKPAFESLNDQFEQAIEQIVREEDDLFSGDEDRSSQAMQSLKDLFNQDLPLGTNASNVRDSLKDIVDNDKLGKAFEALAELGLDEMDARPIISEFLKAHDAENQTDFAGKLGFDKDVPPAEAPPETAPAEAPAAPAEAPAPAAEAPPEAVPAEAPPAAAPVAENPDEDMMHKKQKRHGSTAEKLFDEIEERVSGFFNSNEGTMTIGEEGFVTKMCKELKEKYNIEPDTMRAEKFDSMVERACHSVMEKYKGHVQAQHEQARMLELSGAGMTNRNATENIKARVAQRKEQALPESEELTAMLKIAGLR
jgi:beta-phosphoglucomutase-like phosphatase (HAD superfamily)